MEGNGKIFAVLAALTITIAAGTRARPRPQQPSETRPESSSKAAPEMQRLNFYIGEWDYTETYPKSAAFPDGAKNTGVYTSKWGPGGNSLINSFHSRGPAGEFEGLLVITWDPREKAYKSYVFGDGFPGALVETGRFENEALVFRAEIPAGGGNTVKMRNVTRLAGEGRLVSEQYSAIKEGPEKLFVAVEARKR